MKVQYVSQHIIEEKILNMMSEIASIEKTKSVQCPVLSLIGSLSESVIDFNPIIAR